MGDKDCINTEKEDNNKFLSIINIVSTCQEEQKKNILAFIDNIPKDYSKTKNEKYRKYSIDNSRFSFFKSISDKWYREDFHSDILYTILNPKTPELGNKDIMKKFVTFLGLTQKHFNWDSEFEVIREAPTGEISWIDDKGKKHKKKGKIDLLIKNNEQAIIIENKINYAPDMENQLVRYMRYVHEKRKINQYTVVYLTLDKEPPGIDTYPDDFKEYKKKLKKLKKVYFVKDKKPNLLEDFLDPICDELQDTIKIGDRLNDKYMTQYVYINQYKILLGCLRGELLMTETDKKIIKEIYSSKEKMQKAMEFMKVWRNQEDDISNENTNLIDEIRKNEANKQYAEDFADLWNNKRGVILGKCIMDELVKKYNFEIYDEASLTKKIDDNISLGFYSDSDNKDWVYGYGFTGSPSSIGKISSKLNSILKNLKNDDDFYDLKDQYWRAKKFRLSIIDEKVWKFNEIISYIVENFNRIENEYKQS